MCDVIYVRMTYHRKTRIILSSGSFPSGIAKKISGCAKKSEYISKSDLRSKMNVGNTIFVKSIPKINFFLVNYFKMINIKWAFTFLHLQNDQTVVIVTTATIIDECYLSEHVRGLNSTHEIA